tara:strand:- start:955 stop:1977 length:1023 start_codon:yes stop_codon:yes gene_type:complete
MGIKGLRKLIEDVAPQSIQKKEISHLCGKKIAVDTSLLMYQFLTALRVGAEELKNDQGETTAHISGILYRTLKMLEHGITPIFVFDGKPPEMKLKELKKRKERTENAKEKLQNCKDTEEENKYKKQCVRVTQIQTNEIRTLLNYMGIICVDAPAEAEATCSAIAKSGKAYGVATEDADALTFGTPILIRNLNASDNKKNPIMEFNLTKLLQNLEFTHEQFVDLCILCGCDYTSTLKGIGPKNAYKLIKQHKTIENILEHVKPDQIPEDFNFKEARKLFFEHEVTVSLPQSPPQSDMVQLKSFLVESHQFSEDRVVKIIERLKKLKQQKSQQSLDCFFAKK